MAGDLRESWGLCQLHSQIFWSVPALVSAITVEMNCSAHRLFLCRTEALPSTKSYPSNLGSYH